jgi:hypothetical protein
MIITLIFVFVRNILKRFYTVSEITSRILTIRIIFKIELLIKLFANRGNVIKNSRNLIEDASMNKGNVTCGVELAFFCVKEHRMNEEEE